MSDDIQDPLPLFGERRYGRAIEAKLGPAQYLELCARQKTGDVRIDWLKTERAHYTVVYREELKPGEKFHVERDAAPTDDFPPI